MTDFLFYDTSGKILMTGCCSEADLGLQKFIGGTLAIGKADCFQNYYSDGEIVEFPVKPSDFHTWDWPSLTWKQDAELAEKSVRDKRAMLLNNTVDKINAVRWAAMTEDERTSWDEYRTSLLDITLQEGFPFNVIWPTFPQ